MAVKRKNKAIKSKRFRSASLYSFLLLMGLVSIALLANQWISDVGNLQVDVKGGIITSENEVLQLAAIPDTASLQSIDMMHVKKRITRNPYIKDVTITKNPPNTLTIDVTERTPFAYLVNKESKSWLVDEDGVVLPPVYKSCVKYLPVVSGAEYNASEAKNGKSVENKRVIAALLILRKMKEYDRILFNRISEIDVSKKRDIVCYTTDDGIPIVFGSEQKMEKKIQALYSFLTIEAVKTDQSALKYIDLRYDNQVVVRWSSDVLSRKYANEYVDNTELQIKK